MNPKKEDGLGAEFNDILSKMHDSSLKNINEGGIKSLEYTNNQGINVGVFGTGERWWFYASSFRLY